MLYSLVTFTMYQLDSIDQERLGTYVLINFISSIVLAVWMIYSTICVNSLYVEIKDEELAIEEMKEISTNHENPCDLNPETISYDEAISNK